jgi:hypothetical protein
MAQAPKPVCRINIRSLKTRKNVYRKPLIGIWQCYESHVTRRRLAESAFHGDVYVQSRSICLWYQVDDLTFILTNIFYSNYTIIFPILCCGLENWDQRPWGIRRADHATPLYSQKLVLNFADGIRPVGIVRYRTKSHGVLSCPLLCLVVAINSTNLLFDFLCHIYVNMAISAKTFSTEKNYITTVHKVPRLT